jgi:hypothetical protein
MLSCPARGTDINAQVMYMFVTLSTFSRPATEKDVFERVLHEALSLKIVISSKIGRYRYKNGEARDSATIPV